MRVSRANLALAPRPRIFPIERMCERFFHQAVLELTSLCQHLETHLDPDIVASRQRVRQIYEISSGLSRRLLTQMVDCGLRAPAHIRRLFIECSGLVTRAHRAIDQAEARARQLAALYATDRLSPAPETLT